MRTITPVRFTRRPVAPVYRAVIPSPTARRFNSSDVTTSAGFYKTFGRPVTKVALLAIFTYQVSYLMWTNLELDETKDVRNAEISRLEAQVEALQAQQKTK